MTNEDTSLYNCYISANLKYIYVVTNYYNRNSIHTYAVPLINNDKHSCTNISFVNDDIFTELPYNIDKFNNLLKLIADILSYCSTIISCNNLNTLLTSTEINETLFDKVKSLTDDEFYKINNINIDKIKNLPTDTNTLSSFDTILTNLTDQTTETIDNFNHLNMNQVKSVPDNLHKTDELLEILDKYSLGDIVKFNNLNIQKINNIKQDTAEKLDNIIQLISKLTDEELTTLKYTINKNDTLSNIIELLDSIIDNLSTVGTYDTIIQKHKF